MTTATVTIAYDFPKAQIIKGHRSPMALITGSFTLDTGDYATGGISADISGKFNSLQTVYLDGPLAASYDVTNKKLKVYASPYHPRQGGHVAGGTINLIHSASYLTDGVSLYAYTLDGFNANLRAINANTADKLFEIADAGAYGFVKYVAAATTDGLLVYFDEDATAGSRFLVTSPSGKDLWIPLSDGTFFKLKHSAAPDTPGATVSFDDDAATHQRLLFNSPTTTNGTDTCYSAAPKLVELPSGTTMASEVFNFAAVGIV
uniref:Uncharacterized protein n=1 Tax=viral metagenome TaxID=1070528 RepID=A0A6M3IIP2_9ZZZZ